MSEIMRERMPTIPEDLSEYARIHTGPGSWSAETNFEYIRASAAPDFPTPQPPYVRFSVKDITGD
jgi:hypothetical protein